MTSKFKTSMSQTDEPTGKVYDLEERTYAFAKCVRAFVKGLPRTICNIEDVKQLARASGSIGANYIEANEALGRKDFRMDVRISRKEGKECRYWLRLLDVGSDSNLEQQRLRLIQESDELLRIFSAILNKTT